MIKDLKLLILSCANFSDLWSNHIFLLDKFWPNHPSFVFTSDGEGKYNLKSFEQLSVVNDNNMANRFIEGVKNIDTEYVFVTLDDYFIKTKVDEEKIISLMNYMKENDISYCRLFPKKPVKGKVIKPLKIKHLPMASVYEVNLYPGIWKKDDLLKVLHADEDIWKTEVRMTKRCRESCIKGICCLDRNIFKFEDIVRKGKYLRPAYRFLKKNNLYISDRKIRTVKETFKLGVQTFVSEHSPNFVKNAIKKVLRKKNVKFYSDYENED